MLFRGGLQGSAQELYGKLMAVDFDPVGLRAELESGKYDAEAVNDAAINYVDDCDDLWVYNEQEGVRIRPGEIHPGHPSSHLAEAIEILLDYGLDPNKIYQDVRDGEVIEEFSIMGRIQFVFNGYQAADALYLMLSHGGNPNLFVDRQPLIMLPMMDLDYDTENRDDIPDQIYDAKLHYWMVLVGFGAVWEDGDLPLKPLKGFDISSLRNHREYYYGTIYSDRTKAGWDLCIFNRRNNWEVARV